MKNNFAFIYLVVFAFALAACAAGTDADAPTAVSTFDESVPRLQPGATLVRADDADGPDAGSEGRQDTSDPSGVSDIASFVAALQTRGGLVFLTDAVEQPFFAISGQIIAVNGVDVQAYEYANAGDAEAQAAQISPDGSAVGTTMVMWVEPPHYYLSGRLLLLYVGADAATLSMLEAVLGPQFAGR